MSGWALLLQPHPPLTARSSSSNLRLWIKFSCRDPLVLEPQEKFFQCIMIICLRSLTFRMWKKHILNSCTVVHTLVWWVWSRWAFVRMLVVGMPCVVSRSSSTWAVRHHYVLSHILCGTEPVCLILWHAFLNPRFSSTLWSLNRCRYFSCAPSALPSQDLYTCVLLAYSWFENVVTEPNHCFLAHTKKNRTACNNQLSNLTTWGGHSHGEMSENVFVWFRITLELFIIGDMFIGSFRNKVTSRTYIFATHKLYCTGLKECCILDGCNAALLQWCRSVRAGS
jgi:hypothetical protein